MKVLLLVAICLAVGRQVRALSVSAGRSREFCWLLDFLAGLLALHVAAQGLDAAGIAWHPATVAAALFGFAVLLRKLAPASAQESQEVSTPSPPSSFGWSGALASIPLGAFAVLAWQGRITASDFVFDQGLKGHRFFLLGGIDHDFLARPWNAPLRPESPHLLAELYALTARLGGGFDEPQLLLWSAVFFAGILVAAREALLGGRASPPDPPRGGRVSPPDPPQGGHRGSRLFGSWLFVILSFVLAMAGIGQALAGSAVWLTALCLATAAPALLAPSGRRGLDLEIGIPAAVAAASQIEAVPLALLLITAHLVRRAGNGGITPACLARTVSAFLLAVVPWAVALARFDLWRGLDLGVPEPSRLAAALGALGEVPWAPGWHGVPLILLLVPLAVTRRTTRALGVVCTLELVLYLAVSLAVPLDTRLFVLSTLPRAVFHLVPAGVTVLGALLASSSRATAAETLTAGQERNEGGDADQVYDSASRPHPFDEEFQELLRHRDLLWLWSVRNVKLRYKRSALGVVWTLLEPLLIITVLAAVFSTIFRFDLPAYPIYILSGWVLWDFFSRSTLGMAGEMVATQTLNAHFHLPRSVFLSAALLSNLTNWALSLVLVFGAMWVFDHPFSGAALLSLPLAMLTTALFAFGVGLMVGTLCTYFHDFHLMYHVVLTIWLYATPFIYPLSIVPESIRPFFMLNPLTHFLTLVRTPIYQGEFPSGAAWLTAVSLSLIAFAAGSWFFTSSRETIEYRA